MDAYDEKSDSAYSIFAQSEQKTHHSLSEMVASFTKSCGGFKSPLSLLDKLELAFASIISRSKIFNSVAAVHNYSIPPNWQILLNYLYQQGIVAEPSFKMLLRRNDYPQFNKVTLTSTYKDFNSDAVKSKDTPRGFGVAHDIETAYAKAVGELLERYFLTFFKKKDFIYTSANVLSAQGRTILHLDDLPDFAQWQKEKFPRFNRSKDSKLCWLPIKNLISEEKVYIPAQLIFWRYLFEGEYPEPVLRQSNTNGEAGHYSFEKAVLSGLYEAVERDAFFIFWLNTISPPVLDISSLQNKEINDLITETEQYGLRIHFLDTTTDLNIPSCVCVVVDRRGNTPWVGIGGSAGFDIEKNILASAQEALSVGNSMTNKKYSLPEPYIPFTDRTIGRNERMILWKGEEMLERFNFFISGGKVPIKESRFGKNYRTFPTKNAELSHTLGIFEKKGKGYEVYCYEVKHHVLTTLGYHVVKVVIPQLFQLYLNEHAPTLAAQRLTEVPALLGYKHTKLNPWPHPYP